MTTAWARFVLPTLHGRAAAAPCQNRRLKIESPAPWTSNTSMPSATELPTSPAARKTSGGIFDYDRKALRLNEVNAALKNPKVWDEPKRAQELGREKRTLETVVETIDHLASNLSDNIELYDMSKADGDEAGIAAIEAEANKLEEIVAQLEFRRMFNNP